MAKILFTLVFCVFAACSHAAGLKTALLLEHEAASAWTDLLKSGLEQAGRKYGIEAEILILPPGQDQREGFRKAAASHDLVIVASDGLYEALRDNAANFRRVKFGSIDAGIRAPNIMSVTFADEDAACLAGAWAALSAGTNQPVIGWLSGADTPALRSLFNGYSEGASLAKPGCRIIQAVAGSFASPAAAAQKTVWLLDNGASVIALAAGAGNAAAREAAQKRGALVIELDKPAAGSAAAITKAVDKAVLEVVASAVSDHFRGKEIVIYNLAGGGVEFVIDRTQKNAPDADRRVRELRHELESGSIKLRSLRQRTLCDCLD